MNIMITGGTGFIGKNLVENFKKNKKYKIFAPTHDELEIMNSCEVRDFINKNKINIIVHSAVKNGENEFNNILKMFFSIYQNIDLIDKFINFGSGAEFGKTRDLQKITEGEIGKYIPKDDYGLSKLICTLSTINTKKVVHLRPFGVFGKYEDYRCKFISNAIVKNLMGLPIKIKQNVLFDYLYIDDLFPIVEYFIKNKDKYGDFNITPNDSINLKQIAEIINGLGKNKSEIILENPGNNYQYTGSNKKLKKVLPNFQFMSYNKAIGNLYKYYLSNLESLNKCDIVKDEYLLKSKIRR